MSVDAMESVLRKGTACDLASFWLKFGKHEGLMFIMYVTVLHLNQYLVLLKAIMKKGRKAILNKGTWLN